MMVLKRVLMAALSSLAIGVAVSAWSQTGVTDGNIPAPKLYAGTNDCSNELTSVVKIPRNSQESILDGALDGDGAIDTTGTVYGQLTALVTSSADCQRANPVVGGFERAMQLYNEADAARKLAQLDDPAPAHVTDYANKKKARDDFGGTIFEAYYTQRMREAAAKKAITDWNTIVIDTTGSFSVAQTNFDGINITASGNAALTGYTPNTASQGDPSNEVIGDFGGMGAIEGYRAISGFNTAVNTDGTSRTVGTNDELSSLFEAAFTSGGKLKLHVDADGDPEASAAIVTLGNITTELNDWKKAVKTAEGHLQDAKDLGRTTGLDALTENVRRARVGRDHVQSELTRLRAVLRVVDYDATGLTAYDFNGDGTVEETTAKISSVLAAYDRELGGRNSAKNAVRTAVESLEAARDAIKSHLGDSGTYLQQVVDLRQYQKDQRDAAVEEFDSGDAPASVVKAAEDAGKALTSAMEDLAAHNALIGDPSNPASALIRSLLESDAKKADDGQALVNAVSDVHGATVDNKGEIDTLKGQLTDADGNPIDLSNLGNAEEIAALTTDVGQNSDDITALDGRVADNESDIGQIQTDLYGDTSGQHGDLAACDATGLINVANCADARSRHNEADIADVNDKLMAKKEYIENLAAEIGVDPVTGEGTGEGMSRIDMNAAAIDAEEMARMAADTALGERIDGEEMARMAADTALGERIDGEEMARMAADTALGERIDAEEMARMTADTALGERIDGEAMARMEADTMLGGRIDAEEMARADADMMLATAIDAEAMARADADMMLGGMISAEEMARMEADTALGGRISSNADAIAANMNSIGQNASAISDNRNMIGELSDDLDVVRAGVAASMALAGMPAINGRGIAIGVGSYDGESAFAVGFQIQGEQASFKIGVTSSGGETGASAGVGFNF